MKIAILGAGIQGCSVAMELVSRGHTVEIFDQADSPMSRASRWNEGKLHLGYVYGRDPSMNTAKYMIKGSLDFFDFFSRHLNTDLSGLNCSTPFDYLVPNDSMMSPEEVAHHLSRCDDLIQTELSNGANYLGRRALPRTVKQPLAPLYNTATLGARFSTGELSVDIHHLAREIGDFVKKHPRITFHPNTKVKSIRFDEADGSYSFENMNSARIGPFDRLVNTTWESRLTLDKTLGIEPDRPWLHRYKIALHVRNAPVLKAPSCTMVLGAYGDYVNFGNGEYYLSWYPSGKIGESTALQPEEYGDQLSAGQKQRFAKEMIAALGERIPSILNVDWNQTDLEVRGGHIFAWGERDITHYKTGLHERFRTGVFAQNGYYSIDTGKYCSATIHATACARLIGPE